MILFHPVPTWVNKYPIYGEGATTMAASIYEFTKVWCEKNQIPFVSFSETTSTNSLAKEKGLTSTPFIFLTDYQSKGRGRGDHHWENALPGSQLLCSLSLPLTESPQMLTTPLMGLCLYDSLKSTWPHLPFSIKAPNDIFINDSKVAGILVEVLSQPPSYQLIVGVGINILDTPKDISQAGHITDKIDESLWDEFLDYFHQNITETLSECSQTTLSEFKQKQLTKAISHFYGETSDFVKVSAKGELIFEDRVVKWQEL